MEYRDVKLLFKPSFYLKASWSRDILQIDTAKYRCYTFNRLYYLIYILCVKADRECVNISKFLK